MNLKTDPLFKMLEKYCFEVSVNCNDTFYYACADAERVDIQDLPKMLEVEEKFGGDGINAFCSLIRGEDVLKELQSDKYFAAKEYLKDYEFQSDEWSHRQWIEKNPLEARIKQEQAQEAQRNYIKSQHGFFKCLWLNFKNLFK
jgi:hypothetical protein